MWNYRIIHYDSEHGMGAKNFYGLYEVIYNDKGEISAHTENPEFIDDSPEELIAQINSMLVEAEKGNVNNYEHLSESPEELVETFKIMINDAEKCKEDILTYGKIEFSDFTDDDEEDYTDYTFDIFEDDE